MGNVLKYISRTALRIARSNERLNSRIPDEKYIKLLYSAVFGIPINLEHPKTFSEKIQWLKLYDRQDNYIKMVDKYEVKKLVSDLIGEQVIIPTYGVWEHFDDIDFDSLPNEFVLKCTHDSGSVVICKNKFDFNYQKEKIKLENGLKKDMYLFGREWPYKNVPRRIIAEKYISNRTESGLCDYKIMCFNGNPKMTFVCCNRFSKDGLNIVIYDSEWNRMPVEEPLYPADNIEIEKPKMYSKMLEYARELSRGIPFVRVDFYELDGQIYFGELTFYPASGFIEFSPKKWDRIFGDWLELPKKL